MASIMFLRVGSSVPTDTSRDVRTHRSEQHLPNITILLGLPTQFALDPQIGEVLNLVLVNDGGTNGTRAVE